MNGQRRRPLRPPLIQPCMASSGLRKAIVYSHGRRQREMLLQEGLLPLHLCRCPRHLPRQVLRRRTHPPCIQDTLLQRYQAVPFGSRPQALRYTVVPHRPVQCPLLPHAMQDGHLLHLQLLRCPLLLRHLCHHPWGRFYLAHPRRVPYCRSLGKVGSRTVLGQVVSRVRERRWVVCILWECGLARVAKARRRR